ncbi:hypothetical protein H6G89_11925 [Oscillatoria sp. FACHB-1407]|nr:hypothetical protein [Oscillatoria sp. FACHB-1407]
MVTVVVILNSLIGLACLYAAWRVWRLKRTLAAIADVLIIAERNTHQVLHGAPDAIVKGQLGVYQLRQQTQQLQKVQQIMALVGLGRSLWQQRTPSRRQKPNLNHRRNPR